MRMLSIMIASCPSSLFFYGRRTQFHLNYRKISRANIIIKILRLILTLLLFDTSLINLLNIYYMNLT